MFAGVSVLRCTMVSVCEAHLPVHTPSYLSRRSFRHSVHLVRHSVHIGGGLAYLRRMSGVVYTTRTRCAHFNKHDAYVTCVNICVHCKSI